MTYKDTLGFLYSLLPMFQRIGQPAYKADLNNSLALDKHLGYPHLNFKSIHVAGTNGKGSVSHILAAILQKSGYKTGLYTSPHLKDFRERIKINGEMIPEVEVMDFVNRNKKIIEQIEPSFFEMTVAMAFDFFSRQKIDIAVIETGMGGRLDSTNIINPMVSVITNIGLDHTQFLGDTLELIAGEKGGIIKPCVPVVIGEWQEETWQVFDAIAGRNKSEIIWADKIMKISSRIKTDERYRIMDVFKGETLLYEGLVSDLPGKYQEKNVGTVLSSVDILRQKGIGISRESIYEAIYDVKGITGFAGRWDIMGNNPLIICDPAHNREGFELVMGQILDLPCKKLHIIFGIVKDKDPVPLLGTLHGEACYYFTMAGIPRAMDSEELRKLAGGMGLKGEAFSSVEEAVYAARRDASPEDCIFIGGSTFVVGEVTGTMI